MRNNKQQTAIEWLMNQALSGTKNTKTGCLHIEFPNKALQQAKEMEKEQIENAYQAGQDNVDYTASFVDEDGLETYYKQTYGGGEQ